MRITNLLFTWISFFALGFTAVMTTTVSTSAFADGVEIIEVQNFADFATSEKTVFIKAKTPAKKSVMVIHGLNLLPSKMNSIAEFYYNEGFNVMRLTLTGHDGNWEAFKKVTADTWVADIEKGFEYVLSKVPGAEIDLFGYSLGAVSGIAAVQNGKIEFDKIVLAAPPFEVTRTAALVEALFGFPNASVPSRLSPIYISGYGANSATPVIAYKALFDLRKRVQSKVPYGFINKDGLLFVSSRDEVVDATGSVKFVESVSSFKTIMVEKKNSKLRPVMHHLIIDEPSLGDTFQVMLEEIRQLNKPL